MFYKKKGTPEISDILICTVNKVLPHSIFVTLDEYERKEGVIHISEIAPGRIRNIRDYVVEGKKVICKVLKLDELRGHIDLSLRRVTQSERIGKNKEIKQEQKAEKLLEGIAKKLNKDKKEIFDKIGMKIIDSYGLMTPCFQDIVFDRVDLEKELGIEPLLANELRELIKDKIKPPSVSISRLLTISSKQPKGIETIKSILMNAQKNKACLLSYISAPRYKITVTAEDYKKAEEILAGISEEILKQMKLQKCEGEILKNE
jgi:translation initiation factor 2 subunit 1